MNELRVFNFEGVNVADSREVAEMVGKRHDHLMRDIAGYCKALDSQNGGAPKVGECKIPHSSIDFFIPSSYTLPQGRTYPCYLLTKMGCEMVANKLIGEKGVRFTALYVQAFNQMESQLRDKLGRVMPHDYVSALESLLVTEKERLRLEAKIEEDRPKVEFAEAVSGASGCMLVGDFAKLLQQSGADTSPRKFFAQLRDDHYLMRYGGNNMPTQEAINMGVLAAREYVVHLPGGGTAVNFTPLVTPKGQRHFMEKYGGSAYVRNDL